ncbi:MAG TPA: ribose ABC transporter ATP-binding protein RbsA, partial [Candidatus Atribacteria bacterium]|nr:ribose ABC transporter ATP-binding protein RbsA [Candidatus Atribacteria bacterium]
ILNLVNTSETSIILISSEIEEICLLSDRILVMKDGMLIKEFRGEEINERTITACYLQS